MCFSRTNPSKATETLIVTQFELPMTLIVVCVKYYSPTYQTRYGCLLPHAPSPLLCFSDGLGKLCSLDWSWASLPCSPVCLLPSWVFQDKGKAVFPSVGV